MSSPIVIIGSGQAGYTLAREIRKLDREVPVTLVTRDSGAFYPKPKLSTALADKKQPGALVMKTADQMAAELGMRVLYGRGVTEIDQHGQSLLLDNGERHAYRALVLAVGAEPVRLILGGDAADEVLSVNDLDEYQAFRDRLENARSVAILGAGLVGCEFANDLVAHGIEVTLIDTEAWPMARLLPEQAGSFLRAGLEAQGVRFRFGNAVERVDRDGQGGLRLTLRDGGIIAADLALSAVGLRPRTRLAAAAGITVGRGILVDRFLATSVPHIHALGDCIEVDEFCLPYIMPIMRQARALAATLCGIPTRLDYPAMPVVVKTPACPTVVCRSPQGKDAEWVSVVSEHGCESLLRDRQGQVIGFALLGQEAVRWQKMSATLPAWLA